MGVVSLHFFIYIFQLLLKLLFSRLVSVTATYLNRFPNAWPVEEFLKTYLKNKHAYARKRGYLEENKDPGDDQDKDSNQGGGPSEDDSDMGIYGSSPYPQMEE